MKYTIIIEENHDPNGVRFGGIVEGYDGWVIAEETLDELHRNAPGIIRDLIETSNENGANIPAATAFEFRLLVNA
jgi:hypothetical protein